MALIRIIAALLLIASSRAADDISHPHSPDSMKNNLKSFDFPDSSQHSKNCKHKIESNINE